MGNDQFAKLCKNIVVNYYNERCRSHKKERLSEDDVYVVWMCKTLQNNKALISTNVSDGRYYEITHNGDKNETYLDVYMKHENVCIKHKEVGHV